MEQVTIKVEIMGKEYNLSIENAKHLHTQLSQLFGQSEKIVYVDKPVFIEKVPVLYPQYPQLYPSTIPPWTITCKT